MSVRIKFASISLSAAVDQQTGNLSVFDVIEEVRLSQIPVHLQSLVIALSFEKVVNDEVVGTVRLKHETPNGNTTQLGESELRIPQGRKRAKALFRFGGFPIDQYGNHRLVLDFLDNKGKRLDGTTFEFEVVQVVQQGQGVSSQSDSGGNFHLKH